MSVIYFIKCQVCNGRTEYNRGYQFNDAHQSNRTLKVPDIELQE